MKTHDCKNCHDTGTIGFWFWKKICPVCNGNPESLKPPKQEVNNPLSINQLLARNDPVDFRDFANQLNGECGLLSKRQFTKNYKPQ